MINRVKAAWKFITSPDYSRTVGILALLVVVLAIPLTVFIAQKQQEIRQRAATTCNDTYDGSTFAQQEQPIQDNFRAAYGDQAETKWIQERNAALATNAPKANDGKTLFDEPDCGVIRSFYSAHGSNAPQQWVNERNAAIGAPAATATPPPSTTALPPTGELSINPSSGGVGTEFTLRGRVTASSTDSSNPSYLITKVEIWVTKRGTPDQAPANCPGATSGIWCNIETKRVSTHDSTFEKKWTALAPGDYLFIINGISSNGVWCTGNPLPPAGWADCSGSTGKIDMAEVIISADRVNACGKTCTIANNSGISKPDQCTGTGKENTYFYVQTEGYPPGQCATACLNCPANTKPADDKCGCVPVPTPTSTLGPITTTFCGKECKNFAPNSINPNNCSAEQYVILNSYDNENPQGKGLCSFSCLALSPGYERNGQTSCGQKPIPRRTSPIGEGPGGPEDPPGDRGPTAPPGPTAVPTQPPSLTKLLFDLILPGATKDKRIVAQIFTTAPTPTPTPTTTPDTTPAPTPTPTPTPLPNQIGQDLAGTAQRGPGGNHTGTVDVANTTASGTYDIKVKADKYLRKLIKDVQITQNTTTRISQITLVLGDINGDNKLNIADYNILIDCFGAKANSQTCGNNNKDLADLDDNGRVDGVDYNLFLINLSKGPSNGD